MLTVTDRAADIIKQAVEAGDLPRGAGIRIAPQQPGTQEGTGLAAKLADGPLGEDDVVEVAGARVFLDPVAANELDDMVLDAEVQPNGTITLGVAEQEDATDA